MFVGVRMQIRIQRHYPWLTVKSAKSKDIRHMNVGPKSQRHLNLKDTTIAINVEHLNADPSLQGHQTR